MHSYHHSRKRSAGSSAITKNPEKRECRNREPQRIDEQTSNALNTKSLMWEEAKSMITHCRNAANYDILKVAITRAYSTEEGIFASFPVATSCDDETTSLDFDSAHRLFRALFDLVTHISTL